MRYTLVFEWDGTAPRIRANDTYLGGRPCTVTFADEIARLERIEDAVENHVADLSRCADVLDEYPDFATTATEIRKAIAELHDAFAVRPNGQGNRSEPR